MKKYIIIIGLLLIGFSCRKKVENKFPKGIYQFQFDIVAKKSSGKIVDSALFSFPVKLVESNNDELKMQYYRIVFGTGDTIFTSTSIFQIRKRKYVEGILDREKSVEKPILFSNGEIVRGENQIKGDVNYQLWILTGSSTYYWADISGTYTFSKKE